MKMTGTYIAIEFSESSNKNLTNFFSKSLGIKKIADDLHVTLMYSEKTKFFDPIDLNLIGKFITFKNPSYRLFGDDSNVLVLHFESDLLSSAHDRLRKMGLRHSYPSYEPHLTICVPANEEGITPDTLNDLPLIPKSLLTHEIDSIKWEEIKDD